MMQKFLDSSKLKRHFLIHTGERDFVCPHEGCGKVIILSPQYSGLCEIRVFPPNPFLSVQDEIGCLSPCHSSYKFMTPKSVLWAQEVKSKKVEPQAYSLAVDRENHFKEAWPRFVYWWHCVWCIYYSKVGSGNSWVARSWAAPIGGDQFCLMTALQCARLWSGSTGL